MLPQLVPIAPKGEGWLHEIKHDGYRTQLVIEDGEVRAFTRAGHDWSIRGRPSGGSSNRVRLSDRSRVCRKWQRPGWSRCSSLTFAICAARAC
jgi:hypothetical protein